MSRLHTLQKCSGGKHDTMRGAIAVELALLMIPLLVLALGAAEYGRALYQYNTVVKAARDAVRHLSHMNPVSPGYVKTQTEARCLAVYGNTDCTGQPLAPGLTTDMVSINPVNDTTKEGTPITLVEVRITGYSFNFFLNPLSLIGSGEESLTFGDIRATMRQS